ncbi:SHOCT domain-containing protein [Salinicoccus siamensis]|uniref:SHOCT domain-containing protein n=1 Tax=Salinicoccus siamensis TaxID=381830 RepID=A0ABV5Z1X2_9STAP
MMHGYGMGGFFGLGLFDLIVIIALFLILIWVIKGNNRNNDRQPEDRALGILNERLAKGEISEEEYERLREKIGN